MSKGEPGQSSEQAEPSSDRFWPRFWFNVCKYSEYYYMLLILLTVFAVINAMAMLIGQQSRGAFVISVFVFVILGVTGLGIALVLLQCNKMRAPESPPES